MKYCLLKIPRKLMFYFSWIFHIKKVIRIFLLNSRKHGIILEWTWRKKTYSAVFLLFSEFKENRTFLKNWFLPYFINIKWISEYFNKIYLLMQLPETIFDNRITQMYRAYCKLFQVIFWNFWAYIIAYRLYIISYN